MDAQEFTWLLKDPARINQYSLKDITDLIDQFPLSQPLYLLLAKKAQMNHPDDYERYLNKAAIHIADRNNLFRYMNQPVGPERKSDEEVTGKKENLELVDIREPQRETEQTSKRQPIEDDVVSKKSPEIETKDVASVVEREDESKKAARPKRTKKRKEVKIMEPDIEGEMTFSEWLKFVNEDKSHVKEKTRFNTEDQEPAWDNIAYEAALLKEVAEAEKEILEEGYNPEIDLKSDATDETMDLLAKESLKEDLEIVTETLAKLYVLQKKYDKAVEAYKLLGLKYPDKKIYFAQRIQDIKNR